MNRYRRALLVAAFLLGSCFISAVVLTSIDGCGGRLSKTDVPHLDEQMGMVREELPRVERLKRKGFGFVSLGRDGKEDRIDASFEDHPDYYPAGWGIRSISLRELCQVLGCSLEDFKWAASRSFSKDLGIRPPGFRSPHSLYTQRRGEYNCLVWVLDSKYNPDSRPEDLMGAKVQALVVLLSKAE